MNPHTRLTLRASDHDSSAHRESTERLGCGAHIFATGFEPRTSFEALGQVLAAVPTTTPWSPREDKAPHSVSPHTVRPSGSHRILGAGSGGTRLERIARSDQKCDLCARERYDMQPAQRSANGQVGHAQVSSGSICTAHEDLAGHAAQLRSRLNRSGAPSKRSDLMKNRPPRGCCVVRRRARDTAWRRLPTGLISAPGPLRGNRFETIQAH